MQISANHHEIRKGCFLYLTYGKSLFEYLDVLVFSFFFFATGNSICENFFSSPLAFSNKKKNRLGRNIP